MSNARNAIARRLMAKKKSKLDWAQLRQSLEGLNGAQRTKLVDLVKSGNGQMVGRAIIKAVSEDLKAAAIQEADAMLADGSLTQAELERIYNG